jgi:hypothetical protein
MEKEQEHTNFESGLKDSFREFEYAPAPAVWSRVEAGLHRRRKIVLFVTLAAAATFLLLFGISGWMFYRNMMIDLVPATVLKQEIKPVPEQKAIADQLPATPDKTTPKINPEHKSTAEQPSTPEKKIPEAEFTKTLASVQEESKEEILSEGEIQSEMQTINPEESELLPADVPVKIENREEPATDYSTEALSLFDLTLYDDDYPDEKSIEKSWQLGLGYGTTSGNSEGNSSISYESNSANFTGDYFSNELAAETKRFEDLENTSYSHPISIGIMVNKALSEKWGLETGLLFTRLKTMASANPANNIYTEYVSEILYIGVPLSVRFSIISKRRFGLYASQGLVLEKGVKTWYSTNNYFNGVLTDSQSTSYTAEGVQLSSLTSLGVEYKLSDLISIYLQPGLQVFFLNETQPFNIRSSSPFWPSVQTGLRFQL